MSWLLKALSRDLRLALDPYGDHADLEREDEEAEAAADLENMLEAHAAYFEERDA